MPCAFFIPSHGFAAYKTWAAKKITVKIARRSALRTHCLLLRGVLGPLSTPFSSVRQPGYLLQSTEEARGFASPPHDGFAFIAESTPTPKGDAPTHVQVDTTVGWASSSLGYLQEVFSETRLSLEREIIKAPG